MKHNDNIVKPDLVAPGNKLLAAKTRGNKLFDNNPHLSYSNSGSDSDQVMFLSGTLMAARAQDLALFE